MIMGHAMRENTDDFRQSSEFRPAEYGIQNAFTAYIRSRWSKNWTAHAMAEFGLTEGQARGATYETASLTTVNIALKHKNGGWKLLLWMGAHLFQQSLQSHFEHERTRHANRAAEHAQNLDFLRNHYDRLGSHDPGMANPCIGRSFTAER